MKFLVAFGASVVKRSMSMSPFSVAIVALVMRILLESGSLRGADGDLSHGNGAPTIGGGHGLILDRVTGTACACSCRIATLDDEIRDDPMEDDAIVETATGEGHEVAGGDGGEVGVDRDLDLALCRFDRDDPLLAGAKGGRLRSRAGPGGRFGSGRA